MTTKIEWTDETWNPITGCTKVSPGCANCYAERMARRLAGRHGYPEAPNHFDVTLRPDRLEQPLRWRKPRRVFVGSMTDLFHKDVPDSFIEKVWQVMFPASKHTFQILTKRVSRMQSILSQFQNRLGEPCILPNVWLGVTAEDQQRADERRDYFRETSAPVKFASYEPALGPVDWFGWEFINQIIIGCESGPKRRPMKLQWAIDTIQWAKEHNVAVFVKQLPINGKVSKDPNEWPEVLRVREYPK